MPPDIAQTAERVIKALLPGATDKFSTDHTSLDVLRISTIPGVKPSSKTDRKELANPYNFAAYYIASMPKYAHIEKAIYLDTDVVVQGDLYPAYLRCCDRGTPVAAVEDCSQHLSEYINVSSLRLLVNGENLSSASNPLQLGDSGVDLNLGAHCVFNRGFLVLHLTRWRDMHITSAIERWMYAQEQSGGSLFHHGVSQPPFLLALTQQYTKLDLRWNTRGLSRAFLHHNELEELRAQGVKKKYFEQAGLQNLKPFLSPFSDDAVVLHFNGKNKPWFNRRPGEGMHKIVSLCGTLLRPCSELWWFYISKKAEGDLATAQLNHGVAISS